MQFKPDEMRKRFAELSAQAEKIKAKAGPFRDQLSADWEKLTRAEETALRDKIKKAEAGLYDIEVERAMISRALNGKTGTAEADAPAA